jgi:hypothetical protein
VKKALTSGTLDNNDSFIVKGTINMNISRISVAGPSEEIISQLTSYVGVITAVTQPESQGEAGVARGSIT